MQVATRLDLATEQTVAQEEAATQLLHLRQQRERLAEDISASAATVRLLTHTCCPADITLVAR